MGNAFANSDLFYFSSIIFKNITVSLKEVTPQEKKCYSWGRTRLYINFEDYLRLVFIDEECGNLIVVNDGGELTENISQKKADVLQ